jgi:hypothetical protein
MTERGIVGAAITIIGLWRILNGGVSDLFYVVMKQIGLKTASALPVDIDIQGFVWDISLGTLIILAAPAILNMIFGRKLTWLRQADRGE